MTLIHQGESREFNRFKYQVKCNRCKKLFTHGNKNARVDYCKQCLGEILMGRKHLCKRCGELYSLESFDFNSKGRVKKICISCSKGLNL